MAGDAAGRGRPVAPESAPPTAPGRRGEHGHRADPPWWLVALGAALALVTIQVAGNAGAQGTLRFLSLGLAVTIRVTVVSFAIALVLGLVAGIGRTARNQVARQLSTLYIEVVRGVPMLVLLLWVGFAFAPVAVAFARDALLLPLAGLADGGGPLAALGRAAADAAAACRRPSACLPYEARGIAGLGVGYGAYIAEVVRAGIEAVPRGQVEAALSLGMTGRQAMRFVVLPQALRVALPPLGNDLVALLKDSALVSALAVPELTYQARLQVSRTFQALEVWNLVALVYLVLTLALSLGVRAVERRFGRGQA